MNAVIAIERLEFTLYLPAIPLSEAGDANCRGSAESSDKMSVSLVIPF